MLMHIEYWRWNTNFSSLFHELLRTWVVYWCWCLVFPERAQSREIKLLCGHYTVVHGTPPNAKTMSLSDIWETPHWAKLFWPRKGIIGRTMTAERGDKSHPLCRALSQSALSSSRTWYIDTQWRNVIHRLHHQSENRKYMRRHLQLGNQILLIHIKM